MIELYDERSGKPLFRTVGAALIFAFNFKGKLRPMGAGDLLGEAAEWVKPRRRLVAVAGDVGFGDGLAVTIDVAEDGREGGPRALELHADLHPVAPGAEVWHCQFAELLGGQVIKKEGLGHRVLRSVVNTV